MLITEPNAITFAPGCGNRDRMVKSKSGANLHLVTVSKDYQYRCDDKCSQHKSMALCSHTTAAAESNGELQQFMDWYSKTRVKQPVNMAPLALQGMPASAGRKGGRVVRKKVHASLVPTDENCVPLNSGRGGVNAPSPETELQWSHSCVTQSGPIKLHCQCSESRLHFKLFYSLYNDLWQSYSANP